MRASKGTSLALLASVATPAASGPARAEPATALHPFEQLRREEIARATSGGAGGHGPR
jgi:hypothetical protein